MAQAYFNARIGKCQNPCSSDSAGIAAFTGQLASNEAIEAMRELYGIDLSEHRSKRVTDALIAQSDLVLAMTGIHGRILREAYPDDADKIFTLGEYAGLILKEQGQDTPQKEQSASTPEIQDPYGRGMSVYMEAVKHITSLVDVVIEHFRTAC